jgi:fluoride ion exporter CrcB/FEX
MNNPILMTLLIGAFGGLGSIARVFLIRWDGALPFGLFLSNGLAAAFVGYIHAGNLAQDYLVIGAVGLAGGLSTFSGIAKSSFDFFHRGRIAQMLLTVAINIVVPLLALTLALRFT